MSFVTQFYISICFGSVVIINLTYVRANCRCLEWREYLYKWCNSKIWAHRDQIWNREPSQSKYIYHL